MIVLLSAKAGLRAGEIANLTWDMVLDATGRIGGVIELRDSAAKKGSGRIIPMHPHLRAALVAWRRCSRGARLRGGIGARRADDAAQHRRVVQPGVPQHRSARLFVAFGPAGRSSPARRGWCHRAGGSLRDVQLLAGHASITTTQRYIDGDSDAQRKLVSLL